MGIPVLNLGLWKMGMLMESARATISSTAWSLSVIIEYLLENEDVRHARLCRR